METYTLKVAPDYTIAHYSNGRDVVCLEEWTGRSVEDFTRGMTGRGFTYAVEEYELPGRGRFVSHIWTR